MTLYLLDTNVISELRKPRPHGAVVAWLETVDEARIYVPAIAIGEMQSGVEMLRERDAAKAAEIERWLDGVAAAYNILSSDARAFRICARLMHRQADALYEDAMIAAIAIANDLTVATRNIRDLSRFAAPTFNPFDP